MKAIIVHGAYRSPKENWIPWLKRESRKKMAKNLGVKLNVIHGGSHINKAAGYARFPRLLEDIKRIIKD